MLTNFEFISSNDINARQKARRHVAKEHHRKKKARDAVFWRSSEDPTGAKSAVSDNRDTPQLSGNVVLRHVEAAPHEGQREWETSLLSNALRTTFGQRPIHSRASQRASRELIALLSALTDFRPHSLLGQDHRDPFDSLPVAIPWQERYLVYHCQSLLSSPLCLRSGSGVTIPLSTQLTYCVTTNSPYQMSRHWLQ
jgi:hypothetical protein